MNFVSVSKNFCPCSLVFACWDFGWDSWRKSPFLSKKLCCLHVSGSYCKFAFPLGFLELCFILRYSTLFKVNMQAVRIVSSLKLLEIRQLFYIYFNKCHFQKRGTNPRFLGSNVEDFIYIQPPAASSALILSGSHCHSTWRTSALSPGLRSVVWALLTLLVISLSYHSHSECGFTYPSPSLIPIYNDSTQTPT